jgi:tetratricopeptide (TPR) repeat protein
MIRSLLLLLICMLSIKIHSQSAKEYYAAAKKQIDSLDRLKKGADYASAFNALTKARDLDPKMKEAWYETGKIMYRMGSYSSALDYLEEALKLDPKYAEAYGVRGLVNCQNEKTRKQGCSDLKKSIKLGYKHAEVWLKDNCK